MINASSKDDVLDAFAMEPLHDRGTLERYLREYPTLTTELLNLARELQRNPEDDAVLTSSDLELIEESWRVYSAAPIGNALASVSVDRLRKAAATLDLPRQVITAFREGRVRLATVRSEFLAQLAELLGISVAGFSATQAAVRSYKSKVKPEATDDMSFEQILIDAGVSEARRREIIADGGKNG